MKNSGFMLKRLLSFSGLILLLSSCAGENKTKDPETPLTEKTITRVETPEDFKDLVIRAFKNADYKLIDTIVPKRQDIVESLKPNDSTLSNPEKKQQFDAFADNVASLVSSKARSSFETVLAEGKQAGITWDDPAARLNIENMSGKNYPGFYITVIYQAEMGEYHLKMQADKLGRGLLLGNKFALIKK
jgi:PBP1b-binding outer membrane lipoprotein LpoB